MWYNIYVFFERLVPQVRYFQTHRVSWGGGSPVSRFRHETRHNGRRSKLRVFSVFKGEEKLFKGCKTTWKKGRWSLVVGCFFFFFVVVCFFWWLVGRGKKERQNNKQKAHSDCSRLCLFECVKYCITNHKWFSVRWGLSTVAIATCICARVYWGLSSLTLSRESL